MVQETAPNDWSINFLTHDLHVFQKEKSCIAEFTMNIDILVKKVCSSYQKGQVIPRLTNWSSSVDINMLPDLHKSFLMMIRRIHTYILTTMREKSCNITSFLSSMKKT